MTDYRTYAHGSEGDWDDPTASSLDPVGRSWTPGQKAMRSDALGVLHYRSATRVDDVTDVEARMLADGFGTIDPDADGAMEMLYDWSHLRDSSPEAMRSIHDLLVDRGYLAPVEH